MIVLHLKFQFKDKDSKWESKRKATVKKSPESFIKHKRSFKNYANEMQNL